MKVFRRRWADSCRPFGSNKILRLPVVGANWRGYVYVLVDNRER